MQRKISCQDGQVWYQIEAQITRIGDKLLFLASEIEDSHYIQNGCHLHGNISRITLKMTTMMESNEFGVKANFVRNTGMVCRY